MLKTCLTQSQEALNSFPICHNSSLSLYLSLHSGTKIWNFKVYLGTLQPQPCGPSSHRVQHAPVCVCVCQASRCIQVPTVTVKLGCCASRLPLLIYLLVPPSPPPPLQPTTQPTYVCTHLVYTHTTWHLGFDKSQVPPVCDGEGGMVL